MSALNTPEIIGEIVVPGVVESVGEVRRYGRKVLEERLGEGDGRVDDAVLAISELVTNGVTHSASGRGGTVSVTLERVGDRVRVTVVDDGGTGDPERRQVPETATCGRGLAIVDALAVRTGYQRRDDGRGATWFEV